MHIFSKALLLTGAILLSACASFPKNRIEPVHLPVLSTAEKPKVAVELKFFVGHPDKGTAESNLAAVREHQQAIGEVLASSQLFSEYSFDPVTGSDYPYQLKLVYFNDFSRASASIFGFLSGMTFGVLPVGGSDNYTLKATLVRRDGKPLSARSQDGVTNLIGLIFLPLSANTPAKAQRSTLDNMLRDALRQLLEKGAFGPLESVVGAAPSPDSASASATETLINP